MLLRRRSAVLAGGASCVAVLAGLVMANLPAASAQRLSVVSPAQATARAPVSPRPPLGRAAPSGFAMFRGTAGTASPWTPLTNPPPFGTPGTMLLESDGTVLVHNEPDNNTTGGTTDWWKLTPAANGSYIDGTWSQIASMPAGYTPLYFASAILPDGRMIVEGGEYIGENAVWSDEGAIYNPVTNTWRSVAPPRGWTNMGDAASEVLDNGTFMLQQPCNTCLTNPQLTVDDALLNAKTLTWKVIPATGKTDPNDEEGWTLEPNGKVLTLDLWAPGNTELFNPRTETWSFAGATAVGGSPVNPWPVVEIGPQVEMPGGNTFVVGAGRVRKRRPRRAPPTRRRITRCTTTSPARGSRGRRSRPSAARRWTAPTGRVRSCRTEMCCST